MEKLETQSQYSDKILALAEYLELTEDQIEDIEKEYEHYCYNNEEYMILTSEEVDNYVDDLVVEQINDLEYELQNSTDFLNTKYLKVDVDAIRYEYDLSYIGNGEWEEVNGLYIFKMYL